MDKDTKENKSVIKQSIDLPTIALVAITLLGILGVFALGQEVISTDERIALVQSDIQAENILRDRFEELSADYRNIIADGIIDDLVNALPSDENFLSVVEELEGIAWLSGNEIRMSLGDAKLTSEGLEIEQAPAGDVSTATAAEGYSFIDIEVSTRGDYNALQQFINLVPQARYHMHIVSLRAVNTSQGVLDTHMTMRIYVQNVLFNSIVRR